MEAIVPSSSPQLGPIIDYVDRSPSSPGSPLKSSKSSPELDEIGNLEVDDD